MIGSIVLIHSMLLCSARVYYIDNPSEITRGYDLRPADNKFEPSSRDLDISFSAGEPNDDLPAAKKFYAVSVPERQQYPDVARSVYRPSPYRVIEIPEKKARLEEIFWNPEGNRELVKSSDEAKGEVILELRVITNSNGA